MVSGGIWCSLSNLLLSILYCIPEYCRLKHFPAKLSPVTVLCPGVGLVAVARATSREGRRAGGQAESLLRVAGIVGRLLLIFLSDYRLAFTGKLGSNFRLYLFWEAEKAWAAFPHSGSRAQARVWQMLSAAPDKTSPFLEFQSVFL